MSSKAVILSDSAKELVSDINESVPPTIQEIAETCLIPQGIEIPKPEIIFGLDDIPLFTKKSISTLIGKAKSGKTTVTSWIVARTINNEMNVLWIDTEQGDYYASRTQSWVLKIAGHVTNPFLSYYDLRKQNTKTRIKIVKHLIEFTKPDIVVLDGIRDLVFDINSPEEATIISGDMMEIADVNDCHILSILHQNKGDGNARGHLGTEMVNKSETVIRIDNDEKTAGLIVCSAEFTRGPKFEPFAFDRDEHGMPVLVNYQPKINSDKSNSKKTMAVDIDASTHIDMLKTAYGESEKLCYSELIPAISAAFEMYGMAMGICKTKTFIQHYIQQKFIKKSDEKSNKTYYEFTK